jgi:hypothetical protein
LNLKEIYSDRIILFHEVAHPPAAQARNVAQSSWPGLISPIFSAPITQEITPQLVSQLRRERLARSKIQGRNKVEQQGK